MQVKFSGPLVTTGSEGDPQPAAAGQPHTSVLYGGSAIDFNLSSGMKFATGLFLDRENHFSVDFGGFFLVQATSSYSTASDNNGNPNRCPAVLQHQPDRPGPGNKLASSIPCREAAGTIAIDSR